MLLKEPVEVEALLSLERQKMGKFSTVSVGDFQENEPGFPS
jgi:hypothetical protein